MTAGSEVAVGCFCHRSDDYWWSLVAGGVCAAVSAWTTGREPAAEIGPASGVGRGGRKASPSRRRRGKRRKGVGGAGGGASSVHLDWRR